MLTYIVAVLFCSSAFGQIGPPPSISQATISTTSPTNSSTINLNYGQISGNYVSYCILENPVGGLADISNCGIWKTGKLPLNYSFSPSTTQGEKTLSIWIKNSAKIKSARAITNPITYDTIAPTLTSFLINNASPSKSKVFNLSYGSISENISQYCIIENASDASIPLTVDACNWAIASELPTTYEVQAVNNNKILSLYLKDLAGNVSDAFITNQVKLDTKAPVLSFASISLPQISGTDASIQYGEISENAYSYCILENSTDVTNCTWEKAVLPQSYALSPSSGNKTLNFWLKDEAQNIGSMVSSNIVTIKPRLTSVTITNKSPSAASNYHLEYGSITGSYTHYCIQAANIDTNTATINNCNWIPGTLPKTYPISTDNQKYGKILNFWIKDSVSNLRSTRATSNSISVAFKVEGVYLAIPGNPGISVDDLIEAGSTAHYLDHKPYIDGVMVRVAWKDVLPAPVVANGVISYQGYNWKKLTDELKLVSASGKKAGIAVFAGDSIPEHIYQQYSIPKINFVEVNKEGNGSNKKCNDLSIPIYWSQGYKLAVHDMIESLSTVIKSDQELDETVLEIVVTGINRGTGETRVPAQASISCELADGTQTFTSNAPDLWAAGTVLMPNGTTATSADYQYKPSKIVATLNEMIKNYADFFPTKKIKMIIIAGQEGFPAVSENSIVVPPAKLAVNTYKAVISSANALYGDRFSVQWDSLKSTSTLPEAMSIANVKDFELNSAQYGSGIPKKAQISDVQNPFRNDEDLRACFLNAKTLGSRYLEVFPQTIKHYPGIIEISRAEFFPE